jgi:hypothetical protein
MVSPNEANRQFGNRTVSPNEANRQSGSTALSPNEANRQSGSNPQMQLGEPEIETEQSSRIPLFARARID